MVGHGLTFIIGHFPTACGAEFGILTSNPSACPSTVVTSYAVEDVGGFPFDQFTDDDGFLFWIESTLCHSQCGFQGIVFWVFYLRELVFEAVFQFENSLHFKYFANSQ